MRPVFRAPEISELAKSLEPALKPGEHLVWCGQPRSIGGRWWTHVNAACLAIVFSLFCAVSMAESVTVGSWPWWVLLLLTFVLAGISLIGAYVGALLFLRNRTIYGLTADVAIIKNGLPWSRTVLIDLHSLMHVTLELGTRDSGTIKFGLPQARPWAEPPVFRHVRHARQVFDLTRRGPAQTGEIKGSSSLPEPVVNGLSFDESNSDSTGSGG